MKFKKKLAGVFNMSASKWNMDYKKYFKAKKINYNSKNYLKILKKEGRIDINKEPKINSRLKILLNNIDKYLYSGAEDLLKKLKKRGDKLILASFGNLEWQKEKIGGLKIKKYFNKIILADKNKHLFLNLLKKNKKDIIIINDNAQESFKMKKELGQGKIYLVHGPYSNNIKHSLKVYSIKDLLKVL